MVYLICLFFVKFTCLINLCSSGSAHIMVTKATTKNYPFLNHYSLDECCSVLIYVFCDFSVITHYGDYNKSHLLLPSIGSRWRFGCHSVFPFLPKLIQGSSLLSKGQVSPYSFTFLVCACILFVLLLMFLVHLSYQEST